MYRLAELSVNIIDQCVAQGVPFAREYSGLLANRSFGGAQVARTFYARGQTGQQLLLGAYQALERQIDAGTVKMHPRTEMLDLIVIDGRARGIVTRDLVTGKIAAHVADVVVLCTGGYGNVFYLSTNAKGCNTTATWRSHRRGALFANPCYTQIHPTCIPQSGDYQSKLTLMSESLRNDGRVWVPKNSADFAKNPASIPESERDYYLERMYPSFGNLVPRDIASRRAKDMCDDSQGVGPEVAGVRRGVYLALDFGDAIKRLGRGIVAERYDNLFQMYERITGGKSVRGADAHVPGDPLYDGRFVGRLRPAEQHARPLRRRRSELLRSWCQSLGRQRTDAGQLADGYFILLPVTVSNYLASQKAGAVDETHAAVKQTVTEVEERIDKLLSINGKRTPDSFHRELGALVWDQCGMARTEAGLKLALDKIPALREEFWSNLSVLGSGEELNQSLERAGRVADFLEFGELMCRDALHRNESAGGHFREEYQTDDGEARRNDDEFSYVAAWEYTGDVSKPKLNKEPLTFEYVHPSQRSYK